MSQPYLCPNCKTNKTRFNIINQVPQPVKLDPHTGDIVETFTNTNPDPHHIRYQGPERKIQCGTCGLIDEEQTFVKRAAFAKKQNQEL
ncbi:DNA alkylation repair protein [Tuberibacillus sp. Marseille-P3662]|uniref:DNA alkylation repair protein n=1 Tax=Tuberibacillus sp. Marseille-P3662 TaxID=1965358 RepID=UPI000A1CCE97|nr:DNA alkylation repair protein [Tuberibacillus sp. Marseille-P3662]